MKSFWILLIAISLFSCRGTEKIDKEIKKEDLKIVTIGGTITENVVSLGLFDQIVGIDITSNYPEKVSEKTQLGHSSNITAEGIISTKANIVLAFDDNLKPEVTDGLKKAGIKYHVFKSPQSLEDGFSFIKELGDVLGKKDEAEKLASTIEEGISNSGNKIDKKVLFIYARGAGTLLVSGTGTSVSNFIEQAGAQNAISGFEEFKPLTPESLVEANPDVILFFDSGLQSLGGFDGLAKIPGLGETNAYKNKSVISMPASYISNFGERYPQALIEFRKKLQELNETE